MKIRELLERIETMKDVPGWLDKRVILWGILGDELGGLPTFGKSIELDPEVRSVWPQPDGLHIHANIELIEGDDTEDDEES